MCTYFVQGLRIGNSSHHLPNGIIDLFKHPKWVSWRVWYSTKLGSVWLQWRGFSVTCRCTISYSTQTQFVQKALMFQMFHFYDTLPQIGYSACSHSGLVVLRGTPHVPIRVLSTFDMGHPKRFWLNNVCAHTCMQPHIFYEQLRHHDPTSHIHIFRRFCCAISWWCPLLDVQVLVIVAKT